MRADGAARCVACALAAVAFGAAAACRPALVGAEAMPVGELPSGSATGYRVETCRDAAGGEASWPATVYRVRAITGNRVVEARRGYDAVVLDRWSRHEHASCAWVAQGQRSVEQWRRYCFHDDSTFATLEVWSDAWVGHGEARPEPGPPVLVCQLVAVR